MIWIALYLAFGAGCTFGVLFMWWVTMDWEGWNQNDY